MPVATKKSIPLNIKRLLAVLVFFALIFFGVRYSDAIPKLKVKALNAVLTSIERESGRPFNHDNAEFIYSGELGIKLDAFSMLLSGQRQEWLKATQAKLKFDLSSIFLGRIWIDPLALEDPEIHLNGDIFDANRWQAFLAETARNSADPNVERIEHVKYLNPKTWQFPIRRLSIKNAKIFITELKTALLPKELNFPQLYLKRGKEKNIWDISGIYESYVLYGIRAIFKGTYDVLQKYFKVQISIKNKPVNIKSLVSFKKDKIKWEMMGQIQGLEAAELFEWFNMKEKAWIDGLVTLRAEGIGEGLDQGTWTKLNTSFRGAFDIRDGLLVDRNLLPQVLQQVLLLSQVEGEGALSAPTIMRDLGNVSDLTRGQDMPFDIFQAKFHASQGTVYLEGIRIQHEAYFIEGSGTIWLDKQELDIRARLVMMARFSERFIARYPHLRSLANEVGRIVVPFGYRGEIASSNVYPDKDYLKMEMGLSYKNRTLVPSDVREDEPLDLAKQEAYAEEFYATFEKYDQEGGFKIEDDEYPDEEDWQELENELNQFLEDEERKESTKKESAMSAAIEDTMAKQGDKNSWAEDIERSLDEDF